MTTKYQRPSDTYAGDVALSNRDKYQQDASSQPKVAISSSKMDGDFNYIVDAINEIDEASGTVNSIAERLSVALNDDGSLKASVTASLDEWLSHSVNNIQRVDNSSFSCDGDQTSIYKPGRRVKLTVSGSDYYGDVASSSYVSTTTTVELVDIVDSADAIAVISATPSAVAYSPLTTGVKGNNVKQFVSLKLRDANAVLRFVDTVTAKEYGIQASGSKLLFVENTSTENSPVWNTVGEIDASGFVIADGSITNSKLASSSVTAAKIADDTITISKLANGTADKFIGFDGSGNAVEKDVPTPTDATTAVKGVVEIATDAEVTAGSSASLVPSVDSLKSHSGVCSAWVVFSGTGTLSVSGSYNVSSVVDLGTGSYRVNFANAMSNSNYCVIATTMMTSGSHNMALVDRNNQPTTSNVTIQTSNTYSGSVSDTDKVYVAIFGG